jgi:hypothetical protein
MKDSVLHLYPQQRQVQQQQHFTVQENALHLPPQMQQMRNHSVLHHFMPLAAAAATSAEHGRPANKQCL